MANVFWSPGGSGAVAILVSPRRAVFSPDQHKPDYIRQVPVAFRKTCVEWTFGATVGKGDRDISEGCRESSGQKGHGAESFGLAVGDNQEVREDLRAVLQYEAEPLIRKPGEAIVFAAVWLELADVPVMG